ncbi:MAG TPA: NAD(P)/FAD-dependent oxidoreductase [Acidimicrobiales bacterium]|nr:NAD(P)/FAD-dependent oxidoreductase [Acidimicrobiales bacterium]
MADVETADRGFDPDALRARYRAERDKRVRADGNDQYVEVAGELARYVEDPYAAPIERAPRTDEVDALVIGGGFGGLLTAARLHEAGVERFVMLEKGGDFGGTWYWNRYPGAMCDIESYIYLPLLEELGYIPTEKYAHAPEILAHCQAIGRHFDLYRRALFQTEVTELRWDDADHRWIVSTNRGDTIRARFVSMANGPLNRPKLPGIPGIESFEGHSFHTSRWDYGYTGGTNEGGLTGLAGKRVGIIGTGATAVQCVPHLAEGAEHLYVFQRTPSSIDVRANRPTDPEWAASLEPGWQQRRMDNFNNLTSGLYEPEDLVDDGWTDIIGRMVRMVREGRGDPETSAASLGEMMELADFEKMEQVRSRVDELVEDPATADALKPWYRQFCKRPCFHDEYLQTFNRDNVTLVDTDGKGVERITPRGVVVAGQEYELDCLVYATGFEVGTDYSRRAGYQVVGRDGLTLAEKWDPAVRTFHGFHVHGFPNCFVISNIQSGFSPNFPHMLGVQARHIAYLVRTALDRGVVAMEASQQAEDDWVRTILDMSGGGASFFEQCTPGYYNNEGHPTAVSRQNGWFGGGSLGFIQVIEAWRQKDDLEGLELEYE